MSVHPIFAKILAELGMPQDKPAVGRCMHCGEDLTNWPTSAPAHQCKVIPFPPQVRR
jgi:hypothetical protein